MNVNLYKIDESRLKNGGIEQCLCEEEYVLKEEFWIDLEEDYEDKIRVYVWIKGRERNQTDWQYEIQRLIMERGLSDKKENLFLELGYIYNAIIVVDHKEELYGFPFGHAYNTLAKISNRDFGMDIASREIDEASVTSENINKYFSSVVSQQTNYTQAAVLTTNFFESYEGIKGSPKSDVFGKSITCSQGVKFQVDKLEDAICKVIPRIPLIMKKKEIFHLPRVNRIPKTDELSKKLHKKFLSDILSNENKSVSLIEIPDTFFINDVQYGIDDIVNIYVGGKKRKTLQENSAKLWQELANNMMTIHKVPLDEIKFSYKDGEEEKNSSLSNISRVDLTYEDKQYMLVNGYWCEFNKVYLDFVNEEVSKIGYKLNKFLYKEDVKSLKVSELPLESQDTGKELKGLEDRIIAYYASNPKYRQFHRKLVKPLRDNQPFGQGNELCDIAFKADNKMYLVSTKISMNTDSFLKCIDQSLYSLQILRNPQGFVVDGLGEYLKPDYIAIHIILRKNQPSNKNDDSHIKTIEKRNFTFDKLQSNLLKNKLLEWQTQVLEFGFTPLIFIDILDMSN